MSTILITGASSGIGEACAIELAKNSANKFVLIARRSERLAALQEKIGKDRAKSFSIDVCDRQSVQKFVSALEEAWQPDVLINSAGLSLGLSKAQEANLDDWDGMIDTNLKGSFYFTRLLLPGMIERKKGHIVMLGSLAGHQPYTNGTVYCATKAAIKAFSEALKMDLTGTGVRVTSVDPGMVNTEFSEVRFKGDKEKAANVYRGLEPLTASDIAEVIAFCVNRPQHVNINDVVLMPTAQSSTTLVHREQ